MQIRAVIWDLGGVLVRTEDYAPREALAKRLGLERLALEDLVFSGESGRRAQSGEILLAEHWQNIRRHFGLTQDEIIAFETEFWGGDVVDYELIDYIRSLRPQYKTGLLSNAFSDLRQYITERWEFADAFDEIVVSSEVGLMKPDARIYQEILKRLGVTAPEAVFIDDFARNIDGARRAGLRGIQFRNPSQVRSDLAVLLNGATHEQ